MLYVYAEKNCNNIPWIMISLREAAIMSRSTAIVPAAVIASFGLTDPKSGNFISLALRALLARITVYCIIAEDRMFIR